MTLTRTKTQGPLTRTKTEATLSRTKTKGPAQKDQPANNGDPSLQGAPGGTFSRENIRVCARFRPVKSGHEEAVDLEFNGNTVNAGARSFTLDQIFDPDSTQDQVFAWAAQEDLKDTLRGINMTILAYGQTGAGKTHSMFGSLDDLSKCGIIPRCCMLLFDLMEEDDQGVEFTCSCSMLEIYREELNDLLSTDNSAALQIKETRSGGVYVEGLSHEYVTDADQILDLIDLGNKAKVVASTKMNSESSRSHTIVCLDIVMKEQSGNVQKGRLNLVDLAGSEKIKKTGAAGLTLEEAKKINLSLTALSHCIYALTKSDPHVPFRSSKLTRFLQNSLGGNSKTTLIVACSSEEASMPETVSSLEFATRAKKIKNKVTANTEQSPEFLQDRLRVMTFELNSLKVYVMELETLTTSHGLPLPDRPAVSMDTDEGFDAGMITRREPQQQLQHVAQTTTGSNGGSTTYDDTPHTVSTVAERPDSSRRQDQYHHHEDHSHGRAVPNPALLTGNLRRFSEKLQTLTKRKPKGNSMAAAQQAAALAMVPNVDALLEDFELANGVIPPAVAASTSPSSAIQNSPQTPFLATAITQQGMQTYRYSTAEGMAEQIVGYQAEIEVLKSEIDAVYSLVISHEVEMAKLLERKNLEVNALRLQLQQQELMLPMPVIHPPEDQSSQQAQTTTTENTDNRRNSLEASTMLQATKSGRTLMAQGSFKDAVAGVDSQTPRSSNSPAFLSLQDKLNEQNKALEVQQGVLVKQQDVLAMQQSKIQELENQVTAIEKARDEALAESTRLQTENSELQLQIATMRHGMKRSGSMRSSHHSSHHGARPRSINLRRATSDVQDAPLDNVTGSPEIARHNPLSPKVVRPIIPKRRAMTGTLRKSVMEALADEEHNSDNDDVEVGKTHFRGQRQFSTPAEIHQILDTDEETDPPAPPKERNRAATDDNVATSANANDNATAESTQPATNNNLGAVNADAPQAVANGAPETTHSSPRDASTPTQPPTENNATPADGNVVPASNGLLETTAPATAEPPPTTETAATEPSTDNNTKESEAA